MSSATGRETAGLIVIPDGRSADEALGGRFVRPTVLTNVKPSMTVACEEVFGPALAGEPPRNGDMDMPNGLIGLRNSPLRGGEVVGRTDK